jgi:hypothetical protein
MTIKMISVRVPESLHAELLREAEYEGVSLNLLCVTKLARPLDWYRQKGKEKGGEAGQDGEASQ